MPIKTIAESSRHQVDIECMEEPPQFKLILRRRTYKGGIPPLRRFTGQEVDRAISTWPESGYHHGPITAVAVTGIPTWLKRQGAPDLTTEVLKGIKPVFPR